MLETIHEYALEQLRAAGEDDEIGGRHARFYAALLERAEPKLTGVDQARWLDQLEAEHANLQAALRWASQTGDTDLALLMAARMWRFWQLRGTSPRAGAGSRRSWRPRDRLAWRVPRP
jgi:predicted ATPase